MDFVDLHSHSTASDGTLAPAAVVRLAKELGLTALALTDHDTIAGLAEAHAEAASLGVDFLPGIEVSCEIPRPGTMHVLGYGVGSNSPVLRQMSESLIAARDDRNPRIIRRLNELGVDITLADVEAKAGGGVVGRPHIAAVLVQKGIVPTTQSAFDRYLGQGGAAYFDKERLERGQAMQLIRAAGGLPVLAHPVQLRMADEAMVEKTVKELVDLGLAGLEVIHSDHSPTDVERFSRLADRLGLIKTGGSDFHGANKKNIQLGMANGYRIPRAFFDNILERLPARV